MKTIATNIMRTIISLLFLILIILCGCSKDTDTTDTVSTDTVTTRREFHHPGGIIYVETDSFGGGILKEMKPLPKATKKLIVKHMTFLEIKAVLGPCHEFFGSGIGRSLWHFDDATCLLLSNMKEEDGWYHGKPGDGFKVIEGHGVIARKNKIAHYGIVDDSYFYRWMDPSLMLNYPVKSFSH